MAIDRTIQASTSAPAPPAAAPASSQTSAQAGSQTSLASPGTAHPGGFFRNLLSDLNPLQYIPVVGPIYRAITGDQGNTDLRFVASLGTSFALGGPVGVGITVAEKVTGIDPEAIGLHLFARLFHPAAKPAAASPAASPAQPAADAGTALAGGSTAARSPARAWTADELTAYGVKRTADNTLVAGGLSSADVLNTLELHRLSTTRYA